MTDPLPITGGSGQGLDYIHAALFHAGDEEFVSAVGEFLIDGLERDEPVAVVVRPFREEALREALGPRDASEVVWIDMGELGRNPSRLISAWSDVVAEHGRPGSRMRGVGEPIWPERTPEELLECQHHESLLNAAGEALAGLTLVCPYDTASLTREVIAEARRTHPVLASDGRSTLSDTYHGACGMVPVLEEPLAEAPPLKQSMVVDEESMGQVREFVASRAYEAGLDRRRSHDLVLAVSEAAANSILHAGGGGTLSCWYDDDSVVFEVRDDGHIDEMLVGRKRPTAHTPSGWGLWLIHEMCDLVQLRSSAKSGTVVRMHMSCGPKRAAAAQGNGSRKR